MPIGDTRFTASDGEELTFLFDHEAMIAAEDVASRNGAHLAFPEVVRGAAAGRLGCLRSLVFAGLQRHQPAVTVTSATQLVEDEGAPLGKALFAAIMAAAPKPEGKGVNPPPAPSGTGTRSSAPGAKRGSNPTPSGGKPRAASPPRSRAATGAGARN